MKRLSIKLKIILLYTFFFALLMTLSVYILHSLSRTILFNQASTIVKDATTEVAGIIKVEDDNIYIEELEDDEEEIFNFYHDGVMFLVYDSITQVKYGNTPTGFDVSQTLSLYTVQFQEYAHHNWALYDVDIEDGYILRGIYDLDPLTSSLSEILMISLIISPIVILLSGIGGYIIIKRSFKPINKIYKIASEIKENEDYSKRIDTDFAKDEVYELADMVNQMLDKVEQSIQREKQFSSNVSHELRTPLTIMQAQAEYLLQKAKTTSNKEEIKSIISQVSFMENIITQLLEITRSKQISNSEMDIIEINQLIKLTAESLSSKMEEKKISITIEELRNPIYILANQTMMIRVFSNLIANAIKYNKENGTIDIAYETKDDSLYVFIKDSGIGIGKEHLNKIFDPFYRADESRTQNDFSIGLGLSLVREVVRIHGGDISVSSVEKVGTTFMVTLPISTKQK